MNTELKTTSGKIESVYTKLIDFTLCTVISGERVIAHINSEDVTSEESKANAELFADSLNTIQSCGLLPSELLKQRNDMRAEHKIDIPLLEKWISELEQKGWHQEIVQEMKDALHAKNKLIESTNP